MVDDFMLDDGIIKNKGHLGADILNNIIKNLSIADEAIEEACHEINKHDELYEMHFESFENDIQDFNKFRWEYEDFTSYAEEYDALVDTRYKDRMESICEQLSDIRLENITIDNNLGIVDTEGSHYATFEGTRLKHKINIEDVLGVEHVDKAMKAEYEERRQMVQAMQKMVEEDNWPEGTSEDTKEAIRQYLSNLNGGKMESYDDEIKNLLTKGEFNFITDKEQNLSLALDFVPLVGDIKGVIEAIQGKEMITNRQLSDEEKTMAGISSAVGFIPGVGKVGTLAKVGGKLGAKAAIKEAAKYTVKETMKGAGMYGASSIASNLGISPKDQLMAIGGISLYKGGKAVLKNPRVVSAVNNTVDITKATVNDAIASNKGSAILSSNLGGYGGQLYNSLKKVTAERKALREGIASGESSISRVPKNISVIQLKSKMANKEVEIESITQASEDKYKVGAYKDIKGAAGFDAHHVGQKAAMKKFVDNYDLNIAPAINVPKVGHTRRGPKGIVSRSTNGIDNARQLIARDIKELRRVYPDIPNSKLEQLIDMNKRLYPEVRSNK